MYIYYTNITFVAIHLHLYIPAFLKEWGFFVKFFLLLYLLYKGCVFCCFHNFVCTFQIKEYLRSIHNQPFFLHILFIIILEIVLINDYIY
jgi:hypothetical protein